MNLQLKKYKLSYAAMPYSYRNHPYKKKQVKHFDLRIMFSYLKDQLFDLFDVIATKNYFGKL